MGKYCPSQCVLLKLKQVLRPFKLKGLTEQRNKPFRTQSILTHALPPTRISGPNLHFIFTKTEAKQRKNEYIVSILKTRKADIKNGKSR